MSLAAVVVVKEEGEGPESVKVPWWWCEIEVHASGMDTCDDGTLLFSNMDGPNICRGSTQRMATRTVRREGL